MASSPFIDFQLRTRIVFGDGALSRIAESAAYDPYDTAVGPAIVATFNDYYRRELKVDSDREYVLSGSLWETWDNRHAQPGLPAWPSR